MDFVRVFLWGIFTAFPDHENPLTQAIQIIRFYFNFPTGILVNYLPLPVRATDI